MLVVSYNVLADSYIRAAYYPRVEPRHLDPRWRKPALVERVASFGADVVCLQEVEPDIFSALQKRLGDLHGSFAPKSGGRPDGCATFVRGRVLDSRRLVYSDNSGHVALVADVEAQGGRLTIANTHFTWGPPGSRTGLDQAIELLDAPPDGPCIVCGDFNATPESALVAEFSKHGFVDAFASIGGATCNANGIARRIDFLMCRGLRAVPKPLRPIDGATPLPSEDEPSDHLAISAEVSWP